MKGRGVMLRGNSKNDSNTLTKGEGNGYGRLFTSKYHHGG